jgi:hypothetical protein
MPTPSNFREFSQGSALAARTRKVDSNDRTLLKFDMKLVNFLRIFVEKYFLYTPTIEPSSRHYNMKVAQMQHPQSLAFSTSLQTHILTPLTSTFFVLN